MMDCQKFGQRDKFRANMCRMDDGLHLARERFGNGIFTESFDLYEQLLTAYPNQAVKILAEVYNLHQQIPFRDRYNLYQARQFNFDINSSDRVIDIGSGHIPFPLATHLADITLEDHRYGRASAPFRYQKGKPVFECNIENMPFEDKEFDFIYCSHVLEHADHPENACMEIMRVAKRGYIETPTKGKDIFLNSTKVSNHNFWIESVNGKLIFTKYTPDEIEGLQCSILMSMHTSPQTEREKAFSALIYLKPQLFNTMFLWQEKFDFEIRKPTISEKKDLIDSSVSEIFINNEKLNSTANQAAGMAISVKPRFDQSNTQQTMKSRVAGNYSQSAGLSEPQDLIQQKASSAASTQLANTSLKFLQIHTFYAQYLRDFYLKNPRLAAASYKDQIEGLNKDGFSSIHIFAPYMNALSFDSQLIIANNPYSQQQWLRENNLQNINDHAGMWQIVREQVDHIKPDILYLTDPITFDSEFIRSLSWRPKLILGWRAANIPAGTDWSEFDIIMSSLIGIRNMALRLGAKSVEHFFPGYPDWINDYVRDVVPDFDVVFSGTWSSNQHPQRNRYLKAIADEAARGRPGFTCGFYISGQNEILPANVSRYNLGPRFGIAMHQALHTGRIVIDGRGILELKHPSPVQNIDLAGKQSANMRLFEATGSGSFLLTEYYDNLQDYFQPGVEIETFSDEKELIKKIYYYLDNPEKRKAIANRGQKRCLAEYSIEKRAAELDCIIQKHLRLKYPAKISKGNSTVAIKTQAEKLIKSENFSAAFQLIIKAKSLKVPTYGLDYLRALCFIHLNNHGNAIEALREELRLFPSNQEAQFLFGKLSELNQIPDNMINNSEFNHILNIVKPYTLLSPQRLYSLFRLACQACEIDMPGDFVECGVAAGGSTALLAYIIKSRSKRPRKIYAFDSFEGMPAPTHLDTHQGIPAEDTGWGSGTCYATETSVREICRALNVSDIVEPVKGYFQETLPDTKSQIGSVALLHMDGDWYDSTKVILANLYDNVVSDGFIQVDDYGHWDGCKKAVKEFEASRNTCFKIFPIDDTGVWFKKPEL